jgi:phospholipid/cholesterol/gamma-HCH transport system ATP-binding protein
VIRLENVYKRFDLPVLSGVDLCVPGQCLYGLVGPGASGKSVMLKLMSGLLRPDSGSVLVGGRALEALEEPELQEYRRGIGMLFQNNALFDFMTVGENIAFPLRRLFALSEPEIAERVAERLARVGLSGFQPRMPGGLSGGQKKRVGIARATITRASLLLYDEPAAGLDPVTSQRIFDLLRAEQRASGATVVMVSSDIDRLLTVTDRVAMMHAGRVVFEGTTEDARDTTEPLVRQFLRGLVEGPLS